MKTLFLTVLLLLLFSPAVWAADGGPCTGHGTKTIDKISRGVYKTQACIQLCDTKIATDTTCATFDMDSIGTPDLIVFEWEEDPDNADCSVAGDMVFTITTSPSSGGVPAYDLDSTAVALSATTDRVILDMSTAPISRYLITAISNDTACTDVDLYMHLLTRAKQ